MRMKIIVPVVALVIAMLPALPAAQGKQPSFAGRWQQDIDASKALTEKKGQVWRVAGAGANGAAASGASMNNAVRPVLAITQSDAEIILEQILDGEVYSRDVHKLDGSLSVNASRLRTSRSNTSWKGNALVTTGTRVFEFNNGTVVNGKPATEITETFTSTRTLMPDGTMQVETRTKRPGTDERVQWSVFARVK